MNKPGWIEEIHPAFFLKMKRKDLILGVTIGIGIYAIWDLVISVPPNVFVRSVDWNAPQAVATVVIDGEEKTVKACENLLLKNGFALEFLDTYDPQTGKAVVSALVLVGRNGRIEKTLILK